MGNLAAVSGADPEPKKDHESDGQEDPARPVAMPADRTPTLRRGLLGYRAKDVHAELEARREEMEELRRDVAALWLAFGQHERTIRHLIAAMEALERDAPSPTSAPPRPDAAAFPSAPPSGPPAPSAEPVQETDPGQATTPTPAPPPDRAAIPTSPPPASAPSPTPAEAEAEDAVRIPADVISAQLSDLDDVLAAIEQATRSLERTYSDEIAPDTEAGAEANETEDAGEPGANEPERS